MRYVVAGATGRVGSVVVRELLAQGAAVTAIVRSAASAAQLEAMGAAVAVGPLDDASWLDSILQGADAFHTLLPEPFDVGDIVGYRRAMAEAIATAVKTSDVPRVVQLSATAACLTEGNGPAREVRFLEDLLRATPARVTCVRAAMFTDGIAAFLPAARQGVLPTLLPSPDAAVPMIATRDVGVICAAEMQHIPDRNDVVDAHEGFHSPRDIAAALAASLGHPVEVAVVPREAQVRELTNAGMPLVLAQGVAELIAAAVAGRVIPSGDRQIVGTTTLAEVVVSLLDAGRLVGA